jgi:hypothetical protein
MTDDLVKRLRDERLAMTRTEAADRIEQLERDLKTVLDREAATYARHDAKIEKLEREAILDAKLLADTQALLDNAVDALKTIAHLADGERVGGIASAVLAELEGGKRDD